MKQGKRERARDSRGNEVPGIYVRDGRFIAGFTCPQTGRWTMPTLKAKTLTAARREKESLIAALREGRATARNGVTVRDVFCDYQASRKLAPRTIEHER